MSTQYKGSVLSSTEQATSTSSAAGIWTTSDVMQAQQVSLWPSIIPPVEYLVIAGGGAGGGAGSNGAAGGGGAGGLLNGFIAPLSGAYSITIGAGGTGINNTAGSNGTPTSFGIYSTLGGGFGSAFSIAANSGGSGGGGAQITNNGGAGTAGQGYAGGNGISTASYGAGGGGGAGGAGVTGTSTFGGNGGIGFLNSTLYAPFVGVADFAASTTTMTITSVTTGVIRIGTQVTGVNIPAGTFIVSFGTGTGGVGTYIMSAAAIYPYSSVAITSSGVYFAGGGGGSSYIVTMGKGGAGGGGAASTATAGAVNTGGGGGAANAGGPTGTGGNGGAGVVIISYPSSYANVTTVSIGLTVNGSAGNSTPDTTSKPGYKIYRITAGTGTMTW